MNNGICSIMIDYKFYAILSRHSTQLSKMTRKYLALREENKQLKLKLKELECQEM